MITMGAIHALNCTSDVHARKRSPATCPCYSLASSYILYPFRRVVRKQPFLAARKIVQFGGSLTVVVRGCRRPDATGSERRKLWIRSRHLRLRRNKGGRTSPHSRCSLPMQPRDL